MIETPEEMGRMRSEPPWAGKLSGFTQLFEALVLCLCREMPFAAVARLVGESWHRVAEIAERYVELALPEADFSAVRELAIDETSKARGHDYVTIAADVERRAVIFVTETRPPHNERIVERYVRAGLASKRSQRRVQRLGRELQLGGRRLRLHNRHYDQGRGSREKRGETNWSFHRYLPRFICASFVRNA